MISYCEPPHKAECQMLLERIDRTYEKVSAGQDVLPTGERIKMLIKAEEIGCFD